MNSTRIGRARGRAAKHGSRDCAATNAARVAGQGTRGPRHGVLVARKHARPGRGLFRRGLEPLEKGKTRRRRLAVGAGLDEEVNHGGVAVLRRRVINFDTTIQQIYAATAARPYPTTLFISIFSRTTVEANADRTKKVVETGIPTLVNIKSIPGATA